MKWSLSLLALAGSIANVAADQDDFNIWFIRYNNDKCLGVGNTHKLDNNNCKNLNHRDGGFQSFKYYPKSDGDHGFGCKITVYRSGHCEGEAITLGEPEETYGQCGQVPFPAGANSISVMCDGGHNGDHDLNESGDH